MAPASELWLKDLAKRWNVSPPNAVECAKVSWNAPKLSDKPLTGTYRTAVGHNLRGGWSIPRADLAHYMLAVLDQPDTIGQVIGIAT